LSNIWNFKKQNEEKIGQILIPGNILIALIQIGEITESFYCENWEIFRFVNLPETKAKIIMSIDRGDTICEFLMNEHLDDSFDNF
jgi:hypothetical protein